MLVEVHQGRKGGCLEEQKVSSEELVIWTCLETKAILTKAILTKAILTNSICLQR